MKRELRIFLTAVMFLTRLPVGRWADHQPGFLQASSRYFPLVGWIVGGVHALVFLLALWGVHPEVAIVLAMGASLLLTGAFHEDGFADCCDAFGGGWTKERILEIMKDSRLGTFGVAGLFFVLFLKYQLLRHTWQGDPTQYVWLLLLAHGLSRFTAVCLIRISDYVEQHNSKAKPLASDKPGLLPMMVAAVPALLPLAFLPPRTALVLVPAALLLLWARRYLRRWIGGYTGDCLGALQQVTELACYLTCLAVWR